MICEEPPYVGRIQSVSKKVILGLSPSRPAIGAGEAINLLPSEGAWQEHWLARSKSVFLHWLQGE